MYKIITNGNATLPMTLKEVADHFNIDKNRVGAIQDVYDIITARAGKFNHKVIEIDKKGNENELEFSSHYETTNKYTPQRTFDRNNMSSINFKYKSGFVKDYNKACKKLGILRSEQIREVMKSTIELAETYVETN
ncbi:MAG: hypothetical protein R3Y09_06555 [Clostridia bacterium]